VRQIEEAVVLLDFCSIAVAETVTAEEPDLDFAVAVKQENVDPVRSPRLAVNVQSADLWCSVLSSQ
jgi:hypothetical protein